MFCGKKIALAVVAFVAVATAFVPGSRHASSFERLSRAATMVRKDVFINAGEKTVTELKEFLVCHLGEVKQRRGAYHIDVPMQHLQELGKFLESEYPSLMAMCEGRVVEGLGRLTWKAGQGGIKSEIKFEIANSLVAVLKPFGGTAGMNNATPLPGVGGNFAGGFLAPDVSGYIVRPSEAQGLEPIAENAPWPQVWVEVAFADDGSDYLDALGKIQDCRRDVEEPCAYVLIALQKEQSRQFNKRMAIDAIDLGAPSVAAVATGEPQRSPKVALWLPNAAAPSWYVLRTNRHVDIPLPMTGNPPRTWRFEFNLVCESFIP